MHPCGAVSPGGALEIDRQRSVVSVIFSVMSRTKKVEPVTWEAAVSGIPHSGLGFELNGRGWRCPSDTTVNWHGMVTGMAEDLQSLVGGTVVRRKVYARFLDAVNFVNGNSDADPEQEAMPLAHRAVQRTERGQCLFWPHQRRRMARFSRGVSCWRIPVCGLTVLMSAVTRQGSGDEFDKPTTDIRRRMQQAYAR